MSKETKDEATAKTVEQDSTYNGDLEAANIAKAQQEAIEKAMGGDPKATAKDD